MTTYVSDGTHTYTPTVVDGYESKRVAATIVHQILDRANPDITIRPAALRNGTLRMVFADPTTSETDSKACADYHATGGVWALVSSERSSIAMSYVANGDITRNLDDETRDAWILEVDFHEVEP